MAHVRRELLLAATFFALIAPLQAEDFALTAKLGTLGFGLEGVWGITESIHARFGVNKYDYDRSEEIDDIDYEVDLDLQSVSLLADWHPFSNTFRVTAGLMSNGNELKATANAGDITIGSTSYMNVGLDAQVDFDSVAPYLGVGWGNALSSDKGWGYSFDLGVMFQGSGDVSLTPTGGGAGLVSSADVAEEEANFEDDIKDYRYYPVLSVGASYRF